MNNAGFNRDGSCPQSITNVITAEIEAARSLALALGCQIISSLDRKEYERWAWEAWSKVGAPFITSPPDHLGFIRYKEFMVIDATYIGQPDPIISPLAGRYFGKRGRRLDQYGANLALICYRVVDSGQSTTVFSLLCSR